MNETQTSLVLAFAFVVAWSLVFPIYIEPWLKARAKNKETQVLEKRKKEFVDQILKDLESHDVVTLKLEGQNFLVHRSNELDG